MYWVGLTGGIGTGKSTVSGMLRAFGLPVIDADGLAREVLDPKYKVQQQIVQAFGPSVLLESGELDRSKLGEIVFSNELKLQQLESLLHPEIQKLKLERKRELENEGYEMAFYDVPLLFEKNLTAEFDKTILVTCEQDLQIKRVLERDKLSKEDVLKRVKAQMPLKEKAKLADFVIENNSSLAELKSSVQEVLKKLKI